MTTGVSVRVLASPGFALALVVLLLNDHVLKTAYPGWITGKLSDVAGLVLAPLLLGVLLTVWRVPRPMLVAITAVGLGFTHTKSTVAGAAATSDLWSLTGIPTEMRADITDLLALPATVGGRWTRLSLAEIGPIETVRLRGELSAVEPHTPPHYPPLPLVGETESLPPEPTCDEPVTVSVTPNPQNGPPTTYVRCS